LPKAKNKENHAETEFHICSGEDEEKPDSDEVGNEQELTPKNNRNRLQGVGILEGDDRWSGQNILGVKESSQTVGSFTWWGFCLIYEQIEVN